MPSLLAERPTLEKLAKTRIIKSVAPKWKELGALFDFDGEGQHLDLIEYKYQKEGPVACCQAMFKHWLKGNGKEASWKVLIELLCDIDESELANQVKDIIEVSKLYTIHTVIPPSLTDMHFTIHSHAEIPKDLILYSSQV